MQQEPNANIRIFSGISALVGWFAIITQLYLIIINRVVSIPETVLRFFSFYTILTNILVALSFTFTFLAPTSHGRKFFSKPITTTAIAVYIMVVGIIYNVILRFLWNPQGLQRIVDELLHSVIPVLFIVYWYLFVHKKGLKWKSAATWLAYPFFYLVFILLLGARSGFYPYPFVDVNKLGYNTVFLNCFYMFIVFLFFSFLLIFIARMVSKSSNIDSIRQ